jgi:DNA modification methylase
MGIIDFSKKLQPNNIYCGDSRVLLKQIEPESIAVSVWSPPYYVGKNYEKDLTFETWKDLLRDVIKYHFPIIKPGGFLVINIADILCFKDESMPKIMAENISRRKIKLTKEEILTVKEKHPDWNRYKLAEYFKCSEQTIDRRLNGNNIRGGKYQTQTRVFLVSGFIEEAALNAGFYLYDRRIWVKDAAWENSKWHTISYRSVDESEYVYIYWKPGITKVDRSRLTKQEWVNWGSRGVWDIQSVRSNSDHDSKFPVELSRRVIKLLTDPDEIVLDCFIGSGTTAIAAINEGRRYIGIDKENKSVEISKKAIESINSYTKEPEQMDLFIREIKETYQTGKVTQPNASAVCHRYAALRENKSLERSNCHDNQNGRVAWLRNNGR